MNKRMMVEAGVAGAVVVTAAIVGVTKMVKCMRKKPVIEVVKEESVEVGDFKEE